MNKVVKAVFTLSLFTVIERIMGFFFKIYLSLKLGAEGLGVYQVALAFFFVLLTLTTSGIPLIVSKMTAQCRTEGDLCVEGSISTAALILSIALSAITCGLILVLNKPIGKLFADDGSRVLVLLMLPSLFFSAIYSSFRGNLWGRQKYTMVSLLELAEQVARIGSCVLLFAIGIEKLKAVGVSMTIGCFIAALICTICYFGTGARLNSPKGRLILLIKTSAPITAARASTSVMASITAIVAPFLLIKGGMSSSRAMYEYGYSVGMAMPLLFVPLTIVGSLAFVMIPTLSQARAKNDQKSVRSQIEGAIKMSIVISMFFFPMFFALGKPLGLFVYRNSAAGADAGAYLRFTAWLLAPIAVENITSSMMNSLDMELKGLIHYLIGSVVMFAIFFVSGKYFSVYLMSISMGVSWLLSSALNIFAMRKKTKISFRFLGTVFLCSLLTIPATLLTKWLYNLFYSLPEFFRIALSGGIGFVFIVSLSLLLGIFKIDLFISEKRKKQRDLKKAATLKI